MAGMETLHAIRLFVRTVQDGSLSAAGRHVGLSAASVSRHINALEGSLGVRLLNRSSRKLSLTEPGEVFYRRVEPILADLKDASEAVTHFHSGLVGTLRVRAPITAGTVVIAPALPRFLEQYPDLKVDLRLSNLNAVDLAGEDIDIDLRVGTLEDSTLIGRKLSPSVPVVCASPAYLAGRTIPRVPEDLVAHNCITYERNLARPTWRFRAANGVVKELSVTGSLRTDNGVVLRAALVQGVGIGLMPAWSVADELAAGRLVRLFTDYEVTPTDFGYSVYAVYQHNRRGSAKVVAFVDFLADLFRRAAA